MLRLGMKTWWYIYIKIFDIFTEPTVDFYLLYSYIKMFIS